jgi:Grx4 family monothiol glutaredoxin
MKGTPEYPMCGFSAQVVRILEAEGAKFASLNVLADAEVREGIKKYSNWPTIPQLFVKGEFVGGCDIVTDLFKTGELTRSNWHALSRQSRNAAAALPCTCTVHRCRGCNLGT